MDMPSPGSDPSANICLFIRRGECDFAPACPQQAAQQQLMVIHTQQNANQLHGCFCLLSPTQAIRPLQHVSAANQGLRVQGVTTHLGPVALEQFPLEEHWGQMLVQPGS